MAITPARSQTGVSIHMLVHMPKSLSQKPAAINAEDEDWHNDRTEVVILLGLKSHPSTTKRKKRSHIRMHENHVDIFING